MKNFIYLLLPLCFFSVYAQEANLIKSIEDKKTGEKLEAHCTKYSENTCINVSLSYSNQGKQYSILNMGKEDPSDSQPIDASDLDDFIYHIESKLEKDSHYNFFQVLKATCKIGYKKRENHNKKGLSTWGDLKGCLLKNLVTTAFFVGFAAAPAFGPLMALGVAAGSGAIMSIAFRDLSIAQTFLVPLAAVVDLARLIFVAPFYKIAQMVKTKRLKEVVIPLLEELKYEIENPALLDFSQTVTATQFYEKNSQQIVLDHKYFKLLKKSLEAFKLLME